MADTPNTGTPLVDEGVLDNSAAVNLALDHLDGLVQASIIAIEDDPPVSPANGDQYIVGTGTGAWLGKDNKVARFVAEGAFWKFYDQGTEIREVLNEATFEKLAWNGTSWEVTGGLTDAPSDGTTYGRKDGAWEPVAGGGGTDLGWFNVKEAPFNAAGDGVTDDTAAIQSAIDAAAAAGGGVVYLPAGIYVVAGALQDTGAANAQLVLPSIDVLTGDQITIEFRGEYAPTPDISVIGNLPVSVSGSIIKSTLASGSGGNCIGGKGPSGSAGDFTNIMAVFRDLTVRMPANPTHSGLRLEYVACTELDNLVIDTGSYYIEGLAEPATSSSYGIKMPRINNGARNTVGIVNVIGFYTGWLLGEHFAGREVNAWGCKYAMEMPAGYHACIIQRVQAIHCQNGIRATGGESYLQIDQYNTEHAYSGWWTIVYDVDDASNYLNGNLRWHAVLAGSGVSNTFNVNGATGMACTQLGDNSGGGGSGDVEGPASSTDNAVARFDGTTGKLLQNSILTVGDNGELAGYRGTLNSQTGTTYTLQSSDAGKVIDHANGSAITVTLPNSLPVGFCCTYAQTGAGQVSFSAASGATIRNRSSHTKIAGQWGEVSLLVRTNSGGSAAEYVLAGDTAA